MTRHVRRATVVLFIAALACATTARPADAAGRRFALVMGNADYESVPKLPDVTTAAVHMADTLAALGFDVHEGRALINQTKREMLEAVASFVLKARDAEVVFVYYAGHGIQQGQRNHLIPTDARQDSEGQLRPTIDFEDELLEHFADAGAVLVFVIDACRSAGPARAAMVRPSDRVKNRLIAYPVRAGNFSSTPSRYTPALIESLKEPGLRIEDVFNKTRQKILNDTNGIENPEEFGSLRETPLYLQPTVIPEGTLSTVDRNTYYLVTGGRWRRIPDFASIERLGFDVSFAIQKEAEDRIRSSQGRDYASVDSNMLRSNSCLYYLFWGMKWCVPADEDLDGLRQYQKGAPRSLTAAENLGIPSGDIHRLPTGLRLRFGDLLQVYETNSGVLAVASGSIADSARVLSLPPFMRRQLGGDRDVINLNQLVNTHLISDDARQRLYISDEASSRVLLVDMKSRKTIPIPGLTPAFMALAPKKGHLFVADSTRHVVHVIDVVSGQRMGSFPQVFPTPTHFTGIAVSPDEKRLYVANQGGGTVLEAGTVVAYDLANVTPPVTIGNVSCPEKMSIMPDGEHLYLASQCGGEEDPLFVVDTNLDVSRGLRPVRNAASRSGGFAVGRAALVVPGRRKVYVARGGFPKRDPNSGAIVRIPSQVTVVDSLTGEFLGSVPIDVHSMATALDSSIVVAIGGSDGKELYIIDTADDEVIKTVGFSYALKGVTMGQSNGSAMAIAWIPEQTDAPLYFQSLAGLIGIR